MKYAIFDSGPLINFSINGMLDIIEKLHASFQGKFLITNYVKKEVYDRPLEIKQFELGAIKINELINNKTLEFPEAASINSRLIEEKTSALTNQINVLAKADGKWVKLVSEAEVSCLVLSDELKKKGHETILVMDERTMRTIAEKPENLEHLMAAHLHKSIKMIGKIPDLKNHQFIRSSELAYTAFKKGLFNTNNAKTLEALLYATKFKGSSISWDEINTLKKL